MTREQRVILGDLATALTAAYKCGLLRVLAAGVHSDAIQATYDVVGRQEQLQRRVDLTLSARKDPR